MRSPGIPGASGPRRHGRRDGRAPRRRRRAGGRGGRRGRRRRRGSRHRRQRRCCGRSASRWCRSRPTSAAPVAYGRRRAAFLVVEPERELFVFDDGLTPDYLRGFHDAVTALMNEATDARAPPRCWRRPRRVPGDLGAAGDPGHRVLLQRAGRAGRGPRHRRRRVAPRSDRPRPSSRSPSSRARAPWTATATAPTASARRAACASPARCRGTAWPGTRRSSAARCSTTPGGDATAASWPGSTGRSPSVPASSRCRWRADQGRRHLLRIYEEVAQRALQAGAIIVAAAGNESQRPGMINPVRPPANCPSILAVAALSPGARRGRVLLRRPQPRGRQVDIAARRQRPVVGAGAARLPEHVGHEANGDAACGRRAGAAGREAPAGHPGRPQDAAGLRALRLPLRPPMSAPVWYQAP